METILEAFRDIASLLPRIDRLQATFPDSSDLNQAIGLVYTDITEFHYRAYKIFRRKGWHLWFTVNWGLFERRYRSIRDRLSKHGDHLDKEAASVHYREMKIYRDKRRQEDDENERRNHIQMASNVYQWLAVSANDQVTYLHKLCDHLVPAIGSSRNPRFNLGLMAMISQTQSYGLRGFRAQGKAFWLL